jgi:DNA-binding MarR family transcriptional regulator
MVSDSPFRARPSPSAAADGATPSLLSELVGYHLRLANSRMMNDVKASLSPLGLSPVLFAILELVRAEPGMIQTAVGTELGIHRANLVPLVNQLMDRGLIARRIASHDRRALSLHLTAAGEGLLEKATWLVLEHEQRTLARLTPSERSRLIELVDKIAGE